MRKIMFVLIVLLVAVMVVVIPVVAGDRVLVCHKENGHGNVEMWKFVNRNALQPHIDHGDTLWPQVTICGGVEIPYTPTPEPVATEPVIIPTEEPIIPQPSLSIKLFLPIIRNECSWGWPFCIVPQGE